MPDTAPREPSFTEKPPKPVAGALCLDFVNTITWRGDPQRHSERLTSYDEVVLWSEILGTIPAKTALSLRKAAAEDAKGATRALAVALDLRAEIAALFDPALPHRKDVSVITTLAQNMAKIGRLKPDAGWVAVDATLDLRLPLLPIAIDALSRLTTQKSGAKRCADPDCGWVFFDETRNGSRAWCSMESCGNRAKARAHYARRRGG